VNNQQHVALLHALVRVRYGLALRSKGLARAVNSCADIVQAPFARVLDFLELRVNRLARNAAEITLGRAQDDLDVAAIGGGGEQTQTPKDGRRDAPWVQALKRAKSHYTVAAPRCNILSTLPSRLAGSASGGADFVDTFRDSMPPAPGFLL
jgi:hypothetical protein